MGGLHCSIIPAGYGCRRIKEVNNVSRFKTTHTIVNVSLFPLIPAMAKKATITDAKTGVKAEGYDWDSYRKAEVKAWEKLNRKQKQ